MKKVCSNSKNYNLTEGKEYEIIIELEGFVSVINDKGLVRNYSEELFKEIEEEVIAPIIEDLKWDINLFHEDCLLSVEFHLGDNPIDILELDYNFQTISENCGIRDIDGINNIYDQLLNKVSSYGFKAEDIVNNILKDIIEELADDAADDNKAMLVFSTNNDFPEIWEVLDNWADLTTKSVVNPGSDNEIKMWIKYLV